MTKLYRHSKRAMLLPLVAAISLAGGIWLGMGMEGVPQKEIVKETVYQVKPSDKLDTIFNFIERDYVDPVDIDGLKERVIPELLHWLDPHSAYMPPKEFERVEENMQGAFEGIGVRFRIERDTVVVVETIQGGPSERVGIRAGDRIITVDEVGFTGDTMTNETVMKNLRGKKGSKVELGILRRGLGQPLSFLVIRDKIPLYCIDASIMLDDGIGYIKLSRFSNTAYNEYMEAFDRLRGKGMETLILDLRGNVGGYLRQAVAIADEFLDADKMIVYTQGRSRDKREFRSTNIGSFEQGKLIILIDENSASASEIVAGAVQDNDRGLIMGRRSFGKGLVQEQIQLSDGSAVRITVSRYYTPTGRSIQRPYDKGFEAYQEDFYERYHSGELLSRDSIHTPDSLEFTTPKGRKVYGGGGIIPDLFVPADTGRYTDYINRAFRRGLFFQFTFHYADMNRNSLAQYKEYASLSEYLAGQDLIGEFVRFNEKHKLKCENPGEEKSEEVNLLLRAHIIRNMLGDNAFYREYSEIDKTLQEALGAINKYENYLK